jgi:heme exporter protein A
MEFLVHNLAGERGGEPLFDGVTFSLKPGEAMLVSGANGSGKSTLLRILAGLLPAAGGSVSFDKPDPEFVDVPSGELCHYLGHENAMKPALSVAENLTFWRNHFDHPHLGVGEALEVVGLNGLGHVPFAHLSTGQRRRIAIARLLINYRPVWLLDEPTSGLDAASVEQFARLLQAHLEDQGMVVAATHMPLGLTRFQTLTLGSTPVGNVVDQPA